MEINHLHYTIGGFFISLPGFGFLVRKQLYFGKHFHTTSSDEYNKKKQAEIKHFLMETTFNDPFLKIKATLFFVIFYLIAFTSIAQTGIGTTTPDPSAKLDLSSTNKGFLPPRVTLTSITDITTIANPATALLVYNTGNNVNISAQDIIIGMAQTGQGLAASVLF